MIVEGFFSSSCSTSTSFSSSFFVVGGGVSLDNLLEGLVLRREKARGQRDVPGHVHVSAARPGGEARVHDQVVAQADGRGRVHHHDGRHRRRGREDAARRVHHVQGRVGRRRLKHLVPDVEEFAREARGVAAERGASTHTRTQAAVGRRKG